MAMIRFLFYAAFFFIMVIPGFSREPEPFKCSGERLFSQERFSTYVSHPLLEAYDVSYYEIDLSVSDTSAYIEGSCSVKMKILQPVPDTIILELSDDLLIDSIYIDSQIIPLFIHNDDLLKVPVHDQLQAGEGIIVKVFYHGVPSGSGFFSGLTNTVDASWNKTVTYTLSESFHSRDWFPCKQVLTDKADSASVIITAPSGRMAGSNGLLKRVTRRDDGRLTWEWFTGYPVAYYLLSVTVADYLDYSIYAYPEGSAGPVLIQNFIYNDSAYFYANREQIDKTSAMLELFSDLFTAYPFGDEKYGHCVAPLGGGMEHQTMTSLSGFNFDLVSHELAHQWFGDNVTCATWQDIWINEGFASYAEYLCREYLLSDDEAHGWMSNAHNTAFSEPEGSIYVPEEDAQNENRIFNYALSYKKGAAILHMLRYELNDDSVFFKTLRNFQTQYRNGTATGMDFKTVLEQTSGRDFTWFFNQWFFGSGYPVQKFVWWQTSDSLTISCSQTGSSAKTPFFHTRMGFRIVYYNGSDTVLNAEISHNEQLFRFVVPYPVWSIIPDPDNWVLDQSTIIELMTDKNISVTPNPFHDEINLGFLTDSMERIIILTDLQGKVHEQVITTDRLVRLSTRQLAQGLYMLTVREGKNSHTFKLIRL